MAVFLCCCFFKWETGREHQSMLDLLLRALGPPKSSAIVRGEPFGLSLPTQGIWGKSVTVSPLVCNIQHSQQNDGPIV